MGKLTYTAFMFSAALFISAASVSAWSWLDSVPLEKSPGRCPGDPVFAADGKTLALAGASIASSGGAEAVFYNPSNILQNAKRSLVSGISVYSYSESDREDFLLSSVGYKGPSFAFMMPLGRSMGVGVSYRNFSDMNYTHKRKIYSDGEFDSLDLKQTGGINKFIMAGAFKLFPNFSLGASMDLISGTSATDFVKTERIETTDPERETTQIERNFSGSAFRMGAGYSFLGDTLRMGINYSPAYEIEDDWKRDTTNEVYDENWSDVSVSEEDYKVIMNMPPVMGLGLKYDFLEREYALITFDLQRIYWSDYEYTDSSTDNNIDPDFRDSTRFSAGVEHKLTYNILIRYGFVFQPHYGDTSVDLTMFTLGSGFNINDSFDIDLGTAFGRRSYKAENLFSEAGEEIATDESLIKVITGVNWSF